MSRTVAAEIDQQGHVRLLEDVRLPSVRRALVTLLDDGDTDVHDTALLSETSLAQDWDRPEEDQAWANLQPAR